MVRIPIIHFNHKDSVKRIMFTVFLLFLATFIPVLLASTVLVSTPFKEYGLPAFLRLDLTVSEHGEFLTSEGFRPLSFAFYPIIASAFAFLAGRLSRK